MGERADEPDEEFTAQYDHCLVVDICSDKVLVLLFIL